MKNNHIALYIDLLFCLIIMPLTIMLLPVDRWIVHNTAFLLTLIAYYIHYLLHIPMGMPTKTLHAEKIHTHSRLTDHFNCNNMAVHLFSCTIRPYGLTTANGSQNEYAHTNNMVLFSHGNRIFACNRTDIRTI